MNRLTLITLVFLILFSASPVVAQNSTSSSKFRSREEIQNRVETRQENMEAAREQFRTRLENIRDQKKQKIIENLDKSYVNINARWTTHFKNVLTRLSALADKLTLLAQEKNNATALTSLTEIKNRITPLTAAVDSQSAKIYTVDLSDDQKIKEATQTLHTQLRSDLEFLRDQINTIRHDLQQVFLSLTP